jgi:dephospho-CoA kinase
MPLVPGLAFVGLTGGIGSGKSTVARMLRELGVPVLDADALARAVVAPGTPAQAEIAALWPDVVGADGELDRKALGAKIFADSAARARLEAITHPRIQARALEEARALAAAGHALAFYEASLLVETGRHAEYDALVVVTATEAQQLERVMARNGLPRAAAAARLRAQLPMAAKLAVATHVIDNSGTLAATRAQVERLVGALRAGPC